MSSLAIPRPVLPNPNPTTSGLNLALPGTLARRTSQLSTSTLAVPTNQNQPQIQQVTSNTTSPLLGVGADGKIPGKEEDEDEDGDEGGRSKGGAKRKKSIAIAPASVVGGPSTGLTGLDTAGGLGTGKEYRYSGEISQMMFVFGEVQDPLVETVKLVEDIVRGQIVEIITRARQLTQLRSSRFLSADDVIFLIRDDRGKVNRLRTYLSWKDVRKKAKDDESGEGGEVEIDDAEKVTAKIRNTMVKLPWERLTPFSDLLKGLPSRQARADEDEEQDEDEMQAYQDSMQRLRDADEITKKMTKDEYVHYSECRQASFTYRKGKRFREFVNFSAYLDVGPNDDIVDILGFLSFEMVRTLCVKSLEVRDRMEKSGTASSGAGGQGGPQRRNTSKPAMGNTGGTGIGVKRKSVSQDNGEMAGAGAGAGVGSGDQVTLSPEGIQLVISPEKADIPLPSQPPSSTAVTSTIGPTPTKRSKTTEISPSSSAKKADPPSVSLFAPPPSARQPLLPSHVLEAFAQIQREQVGGRVGGMRNFRGGVMRGRLALV